MINGSLLQVYEHHIRCSESKRTEYKKKMDRMFDYPGRSTKTSFQENR